MRILLSLFLLTLVACSAEETSGPGELRWDRETCARCNMAVGDRYYAAQIRRNAGSSETVLYKFDDIGCAVIWLQQQDWKDDAGIGIWVSDHRNGEWIDARTASYVKVPVSPMNYGLGAQPEVMDGALNYSQARAHIMTVEGEHQRHPGKPGHEQ